MQKFMKKFIRAIGNIFVVAAILFLLIHSFVVVSDGSVTKDLLGFTIPHPPQWIIWVPYLGGLIGFFYCWFSIHGLIGVVIIALLMGVGIKLISFGQSK